MCVGVSVWMSVSVSVSMSPCVSVCECGVCSTIPTIHGQRETMMMIEPRRGYVDQWMSDSQNAIHKDEMTPEQEGHEVRGIRDAGLLTDSCRYRRTRHRAR